MNPLLDRLPILVIEPQGRCNCRCAMCDIWKITDSREMTETSLEGQLESISQLGVEWVVFTGGEPLMHTRLFAMCRTLRERGVRVTILSSGLLLARHAERITSETDEVIVSLDGPAAVHDAIRGVPRAFDLLAEGVRAIRRCDPAFPVAGRCTVQARNAAHLRETVDAARALGLRSLSFLAADLASEAFNRPLAWPAARQSELAPDSAVLEQEIERLIAEQAGDGFVLEPPTKLRRIAAHFRAYRGVEPHAAPLCNAPWVSAVVEPTGDVRPCFFHPAIGNLAQGSLLEVLNSPRAVAFRESLNVQENPVCQKCVCSLHRT